MPISIRPVSPADLATIDRWAAAIGGDFLSRTRPCARDADRHDPGSGLYWYLIDEDRREVGTVWIERLPEHSEAVLGAFLGDSADFGRGIGTAAIGLAVSEFWRAYPHEPVSLRVRRSNARALACYRRVGFVVTGTGAKRARSGDAIPFYRMVLPPRPALG